MSDSESSQDFRIDGDSDSEGFIEPAAKSKKVAPAKKTVRTTGGAKAVKVNSRASVAVSSAGSHFEVLNPQAL